MKRHFAEYFSIAMYIGVGVTGILVSWLAFAGKDFESGPWAWLKGTQQITLLIVVALALGLGIERLSNYQNFRRLNDHFGAMEDLMKRRFEVRFLEGEKEIQNATIEISRNTHEAIRAFVFATTLQPVRPKINLDIAKEIAIVLKEAKRQGRPATFEIIAAWENKELPKEFVKASEERGKIYKEYGVLEWINRRMIYGTPPIGFDMFLVDRKHALISWSPRLSVEDAQRGFLFYDCPEIAEELTDLYDQIAKKYAK